VKKLIVFPLESLIGCRITFFGRTLNSIRIWFQSSKEETIKLHIQCYFRIYENDRLLLSQDNLYSPSKSLKGRKLRKFKWSKPEQSLFDDGVSEYRSKLLASNIKNIVTDNIDLQIYLDNNI